MVLQRQENFLNTLDQIADGTLVYPSIQRETPVLSEYRVVDLPDQYYETETLSVYKGGKEVIPRSHLQIAKSPADGVDVLI
jgi:hypothetical protein